MKDSVKIPERERRWKSELDDVLECARMKCTGERRDRSKLRLLPWPPI